MGPSLAPGTVVAGDYRVLRPLAQGGMGAVFVAEQISTRKLRAVKLMHPELLADEAWRRRFEQEARVGARIASEHVVEVQAAGVEPATGAPYLVMELLEGEDLDAVLRRRGRLPPGEVRIVMEQICHAVGAAHAAGIVHRDLKPGNVFLAVARRTDVSFTVKVLDFGIAKVVTERTSETAAMGSPLWLAPEQADRSSVTPAADVWALGLIAYALLTGSLYWRVPRGAEASLMQLMREILFDPLVPASTRAAEVGAALPAGFDGWFARAVARSPQERFPDARQAFAALAPVLGGPAPDWSQLPATNAPYPALPPPAAALGSSTGWDASSPGLGPSTGGYGYAGSSGAAPWPSSPSLGANTAGSAAWNSTQPRAPSGALALGCAGSGALALALALVLVVGLGGVVLFLARGAPRGVTPSSSTASSRDGAARQADVAATDESAEDELDRGLDDAMDEAFGSSDRPRPPPRAAAPLPGATPPPPTPGAPADAPAAPPGPAKPRGVVSTLFGGSNVSALPANGSSLIRSLEPRMLGCYNARVGNDGVHHSGETLIFWITIGAGGEVKGVESRIDTAPPGVGLCVLGVLQGVRFQAPPAGQVVGNLIANFSTRD